MAMNKTAVFLASRFEEFKDLRELVKRKITDWPGKQLSAIDLNDGNVSHRPPLAECLGYVRRAEFMILLLGDTYGGLAPKSDKSFTHLEYEEAIRDGSNTRVLVFCIGESYVNRRITYSTDARLASWQKQVEENHTIGYFDLDSSLETMAQQIFDRLLSALYDMHFGALSVDAEDSADLLEAISDDSIIDDSEINSMEEREAQTRGVSLVDDRSKLSTAIEMMAQPLAVAALEHREEAQRAIEIGEYGIAIRHLKKALDHRPLDLMANYWLAQLYLALGNKKSCIEAIELAERAAHVAEHGGGKIRAAGAYMIAAKAAQLSNQDGGGLPYAKLALEVAPHYSRVHIEMARQHVLNGTNKEALIEIEEAFRLYPKSLREILGDPTFRPIRAGVNQIIQKIKDRVRSEVQQILDIEERIYRKLSQMDLARPEDFSSTATDGQLSLSKLYEIGRDSVRRQHRLVTKVIVEAIKLGGESSTELSEESTQGNRESFPFKYPGSIQVLNWFKHPGQVIAYEEAIFSYSFENNDSVRNWLWMRKTPVRMSKQCIQSGGFVTSDNPVIFEHIPTAQQLKAQSTALQLTQRFERESQKLLTTKKSILNAEVNLSRLNKSKPVGMWLVIFGLFIALLVLYFGQPFWALGAAIVLIPQLAKAYARHQEHARQIKHLENRIVEDRQVVLNTEVSAQSLNAELEQLREKSNLIQAIANEVMNDFESVCLRASARMLPFASTFGCKENDLIRLKEAQLNTLQERLDRIIEIVDPLPELLTNRDQVGRKSIYSLYRVVAVSSEKLTLSRASAYSS